MTTWKAARKQWYGWKARQSSQDWISTHSTSLWWLRILSVTGNYYWAGCWAVIISKAISVQENRKFLQRPSRILTSNQAVYLQWCLHGSREVVVGITETPSVDNFMQLQSWITLYLLPVYTCIFLSWITVTMVTAMQIATLKRNLNFANFTEKEDRERKVDAMMWAFPGA